MTEESKPAAAPSWMVGKGADADMKGDYSARMPFRFWLGTGKSREIVFLTQAEDAPVIWEHQFQAMKNGKSSWSNYATCLKAAGEHCPMCEFADAYGKFGRQKVRLFAVLDLTPWENKRTKKTVPYSRMILAAKARTSELIMRRYTDLLDDGKKLRGAAFKVFRSNDSKSPGVGDDYTLKGQFDLSKLPEEDTADFDWMKFAPDLEQLIDAVNKCRSGVGVAPISPNTIPTASSNAGFGSGAGFDDIPTVEVEYD